MYKVKGLMHYIGPCEMYDCEKTFLTRFFAKRFYVKLAKIYEFAIMEEKFGQEWVEITSSVKKASGYLGKNELKCGSEKTEQASEQMDYVKRIVYDVDDTLWALTEIICSENDIDIRKIKRYKISENTFLTEKEKNEIMEGYKDPVMFKRCKFHKGIDRIYNLEKEGLAEVWISSANLNEDVKAMKMKRLLKEIPNINANHIKLTVGKNSYQGRVPGYVLIDDNLENIKNNEFQWNILIDMPYNADLSEVKNKKIIRVYSLEEAIDTVEKIIKER